MSTYVITGATRGVGRAVVDRLSGHSLVLLGRDSDALAKLCAELPDATAVVADLSRPETLVDAIGTAGVSGPVDGLLHIAGVSSRGVLADFPLAAWREMFDVNVLAATELLRALLPALRAAHGRVLLVNSGAGLAVRGTGGAAYAASKFALRAVADGLRLEEPDIRVTSLYLGFVATEMQRALREYSGQPYRPEDYLSTERVAEVIGQLLEKPADVDVPDMTLRPG